MIGHVWTFFSIMIIYIRLKYFDVNFFGKQSSIAMKKTKIIQKLYAYIFRRLYSKSHKLFYYMQIQKKKAYSCSLRTLLNYKLLPPINPEELSTKVEGKYRKGQRMTYLFDSPSSEVKEKKNTSSERLLLKIKMKT